MLTESTLGSYNKYTLCDDFVKKEISAQVAMDTDQSDCEITGIIVKTNNGAEQSISADVIAQIDLEIAKSLKVAFSKIGDFGFDNQLNVGDNKSNVGDNKPNVGSNSFLQDEKLENVKNIEQNSELTDVLKETDITTKVSSKMPDTSETSHQKATSVSKEETDVADVDEIFQEESLPLSFKNTLQKSSKCCVNGFLKSLACEDGPQVEDHSITEDLPDIVKEECANVDKGDKVEGMCS